MEAFRKKEKERHQLYQQSTTSEKRAIIREQVRCRVARHRAKHREEGQSGTRATVASWKVKLKEKQTKDGEYQRRRRAALTEEERKAINKRRREQYHLKKLSCKSPDDPISSAAVPSASNSASPPAQPASVSPEPSSSTSGFSFVDDTVSSPQISTPSASSTLSTPSTCTGSFGSPYKNRGAVRKAHSRARKRAQEPQNPQKYAQLMMYKLQMALKSPRKRKALTALGLSINKPPGHVAEARIVRRLTDSLEKLTPKRDKMSVQQRKTIVAAVSKSAINIKELSEELSQRWHFVQRCSTLQCEQQEVSKFHASSVPPELQEEVKNFFQQSESATWIPDWKQVKKDLVPRMVLKKTLKRLHEDFQRETGKCISLSAFTKLRPQHVLTMDKAKHMSCLCEQCTNIAQKTEALKIHLKETDITGKLETVESTCAVTLCSLPETSRFYQRDCIERKCNRCGVNTLKEQLLNSLPMKQQIQWLRWEKDSKHQSRKVNVTKQGTVADLIEELLTEITPLALHLHVAKWQYHTFRQLRDHLPENWVLTLMDFAQNYRCENQNEVQAAHWSYEQASVFPTVSYYQCPDCQDENVIESVVFITPDLNHDADAVSCFSKLLAQHLQETRQLSIVKQVQFTDGAASQFKSKTPFLDISHSTTELGFLLERSFFGTSHGKGPCDGLGGMAKSATRRAVLAQRAAARNAREMCDFLQAEYTDDLQQPCVHSKRLFIYVEAIPRLLRKIPKNPLPHTRKQHCVKGGQSVGEVKARNLSCYCRPCITSTPGCEQAEHVRPWLSHVFTFGKESSSHRKPQAPEQAPNKQAQAPEQAPSKQAEAPEQSPSKQAEASEQAPSKQAEAPEQAPSNEAEAPEQAPSNEAEAPEQAPSNEAEAPEQAPSNEAEAPEQAPSNEAEAPEQAPSNEAEAPEQAPSNEAEAPEEAPSNEAEAPEQAPSKQAEAPEQAPSKRAGEETEFPSVFPEPQNQEEVASASHNPQYKQEQRGAFFANMQKEMSAARTFHEILKLAQQFKAPMKMFDVSCMNLTAYGYRTDEVSLKLYPSDGPALTPVTIYGDGNCLPRAGSLFAFGTEDKHVEMRIRLACELALNAEFYLSDASLSVGLQAGKPYTKFYATYTPQYTMQVLTPAVIREIYEGEVLQWTKNGTYAGMWELHALSSVLGTTIHSIYPQYGGFNVRPHLHRIVHPRRPAVPPNFVPGVMWTSTHGTAAAANVWAPNHFVACLPRAADGLNSTSSSFIPQLKPGDFIKVKVPKKNGPAVIYMAQVTQKEGGVISGRYLKPWGAAWKFSDALSFVEEYQIPLQDIAEKMDSAVLHDDGRNIYYTF